MRPFGQQDGGSVGSRCEVMGAIRSIGATRHEKRGCGKTDGLYGVECEDLRATRSRQLGGWKFNEVQGERGMGYRGSRRGIFISGVARVGINPTII